MKIKLFNSLLIIDILTILLILSITFIPSSPVRVVLGLPFLLFFPGYMLVAALFARKEGMDGIERVALSFGMSIAVTALIGLGLNYTRWGIRLEPVMYSIAAFIIIMSIVALLRRGSLKKKTDLVTELNIKMSGWEGTAFNKFLTVVLAVCIVGAIGTLIYTVASPKVGEKFTEYYILGLNGKADVYPAEFTLTGGRITTVKYGDGIQTRTAQYGEVTLGIMNHEQAKVVYSVIIKIDGQQVSINYGGQNVNKLDQIALEQDGKWEQQIGFAPLHIGENQKVEFLLYKDGGVEDYNELHLWVNAVGE